MATKNGSRWNPTTSAINCVQKIRTDLNTIINENPNLILQVTASDLRYFLDDLIFEIRSMTLDEAKEIKRGDSLMTIDEASKVLSVPKMTLYRWDKAGVLKNVEIGGKRRGNPFLMLFQQRSAEFWYCFVLPLQRDCKTNSYHHLPAGWFFQEKTLSLPSQKIDDNGH